MISKISGMRKAQLQTPFVSDSNDIEMPTELQENSNKYVKSKLSAEQVTVLAESGIPFYCKKTDDTHFVIAFEREDLDKVNQVLGIVLEQNQPPYN